MEWIIFLIVFGILFLGELGDKTQLIVFNLAIEQDFRPYKVGIGATLGFAVIVTVGVFFGIVITRFIPLSTITFVSGIIFITVGILEARTLKSLYRERCDLKSDEILSSNKKATMEGNINHDITSRFSKLKKNPYIAGFSFIFLMELGDKTQILTITLASIYPYPFEVWLGSFLALISLAWIGVLFGSTIAQKIPRFHLKVASVVIFVSVGVFILITSL